MIDEMTLLMTLLFLAGGFGLLGMEWWRKLRGGPDEGSRDH